MKKNVKTIWLTGLSGSGKTSLSEFLKLFLIEKGEAVYILDGDAIRLGLNSDLGFSENDKSENARRVANVCRILNSCGITVIVCLVSPYESDRLNAKKIINGNFILVYLDASPEICASRDIKGLYAKAKRGEILGLSGINSPYEFPESADIVVNTSKLSPKDSALKIISSLF